MFFSNSWQEIEAQRKQLAPTDHERRAKPRRDRFECRWPLRTMSDITRIFSATEHGDTAECFNRRILLREQVQWNFVTDDPVR